MAAAGSEPPSGIRIETGFTPLAFLLYLCRPRLVLDGGDEMELPWGDAWFPVAPGDHTVRCWYRYLFWKHAGDATVTVYVGPGQVTHARYRPAAFVFMAGKWKVDAPTPVAPAPVQAEGWFEDPSGRHEFRYWDGTSWTEHVSDGDTRSVDPPT